MATLKIKNGNVVASNVATDFEIEGEYPQFGNNDARVDDIACDLVERFMKKNSNTQNLSQCNSDTVCTDYHF